MNVGRADRKGEFEVGTNIESRLLKRRKGTFPGQSLRKRAIKTTYGNQERKCTEKNWGFVNCNT